MLHLFNTLSGRREAFESIEPNNVRMYVCGVTVYDYCHIGHARSALVFDVLRRYLEQRGYSVTFVKNFTDVDDKIIKRANEQRISCEAVTEKYIQAYYEDMGKLGIRRATEEPKATEHMGEIIRMTEALIRRELAYVVDGDVYFQVEQYPSYGRLSKRKLEDLQAGARVDVDERKRHPMDFALWKSSKPGEPSWPSPWGDGRPGWHIECSAMSIKHLGETFDIHGGGMDLIFPHHENEIAQSCGATGREFARYWVHNGFVQVNQEKMSKSLGNFFTIREIFEKSEWPEPVTGEMLRYFLLSTHYHGPLDFSDHAIWEAKNALNGFYDLFNRLRESGDPDGRDHGSLDDAIDQARRMFVQAMDDDLNTPAAIAALQGLRSDVNKLMEKGLSTPQRETIRNEFRSLGSTFGLFQSDIWQFSSTGSDKTSAAGGAVAPVHSALTDHDVAQLLEERKEARRLKDYKRADEIRRSLAGHGIIIEDKPDGTTRWKR
jgi:cysteinyl-tRNA synthetase